MNPNRAEEERLLGDWFARVQFDRPAGTNVDPDPSDPDADVAASAGTDPSAAEPKTTNNAGGSDMPLMELNKRLGLAEDADETAVLAAVDELKVRADKASEVNASAGELTKEVDLLKGQVQTLSGQVAAAAAEKAATVKASVLDGAIGAGKIKPADREQWGKDYDEAPAAVTRVLASIAPGTAVPVTPSGTSGTVEAGAGEADDALYERVYGKQEAGK